MLTSSSPPRPPLYVLLAVLLGHYWRWGYAYGTGDHDEMIPQLLHHLDPGLFARDWFVQMQEGLITVRSVFLWLLQAGSAVLPLEAVVALLHALVLMAVAAGLYRLSQALGAGRLAATVAAFVPAVMTPYWTLGGNALTYGILVPEGIAWALAVPALALFVQGRRLRAALLLGVAAWVQPLVGVQTATVLGMTCLAETVASTDRSSHLLGTLRFGLVFGATAAVVILPILLTSGTPAAIAPPPLGSSAADATAQLSAFYILASLRVPHHYLPLSFPLSDYARFGFVVMAGVAAFVLLRQRNRLRHGAFVVRFLSSTVLLTLLAFLFTEGFPTLFVAQLQLFKLTVLASTMLVVLACMGGVALLPEQAQAWGERLLTRRSLGWAAVGATLAATLVLVTAGVGRPYTKLQPAAHRGSDAYAVERWARTHTDQDALFLIPPSNTTFRSYARRSVVINHKPVPFQQGAMHVWLARLLAVAPAPLPERGVGFIAALDSAYHRNTRADWQQLAETFSADYVLAEWERLPEAPAETPVARVGKWGLYRLRLP